jgi:hypothetical protein
MIAEHIGLALAADEQLVVGGTMLLKEEALIIHRNA